MTITTRKPMLSMVDVNDVVIDPRYQRALDAKRVVRIAENFRWDQFGVLEVSERENATYAIFDGQHRLSAAMRLGLERVPCLIHRGLTAEEEAVLFTLLQTERRGLRQTDRFKAQVFAKDPRSVAIDGMLKPHGFAVGRQREEADSNRMVSAVVTLERIYKRFGADHLDLTLGEIRKLWGDDLRTGHGRLIEGLALFLADYGDHRYTPIVQARLTQVAPTTILRRAEAAHAGDARASQAANAEIRKVARVSGRPRTFHKTKAVS